MRMRYIVLTAIMVVVLSGVLWALYLYNKPHQGVAGLSAELRVSATELFDFFRRDEAAANRRFAGKVIARDIRTLCRGQRTATSQVVFHMPRVLC